MPGSGVRPAYGLSDGQPQAWMPALLGVLRRAQSAEEADFARTMTSRPDYFPLASDRLFAAATRLVGAPDGRRYAVTAGDSVPDATATRSSPHTCTMYRRRALRRLLSRASAPLRRRAWAIDNTLARQRHNATTPPGSLGIVALDGHAVAGGGPSTATGFRREGVYGATLTAGGIATVYGLVPDGVAAVRGDFAGTPVRAEVRENVFSLTAPNHRRSNFPERILWRDSAGKITNIWRPEILYSDFARPQ